MPPAVNRVAVSKAVEYRNPVSPLLICLHIPCNTATYLVLCTHYGYIGDNTNPLTPLATPWLLLHPPGLSVDNINILGSCKVLYAGFQVASIHQWQ